MYAILMKFTFPPHSSDLGDMNLQNFPCVTVVIDVVFLINAFGNLNEGLKILYGVRGEIENQDHNNCNIDSSTLNFDRLTSKKNTQKLRTKGSIESSFISEYLGKIELLIQANLISVCLNTVLMIYAYSTGVRIK